MEMVPSNLELLQLLDLYVLPAPHSYFVAQSAFIWGTQIGGNILLKGKRRDLVLFPRDGRKCTVFPKLL